MKNITYTNIARFPENFRFQLIKDEYENLKCQFGTSNGSGTENGYGNMKTATRCLPSGVARYDKEPIIQNESVDFTFRNKEYHVYQ